MVLAGITTYHVLTTVLETQENELGQVLDALILPLGMEKPAKVPKTFHEKETTARLYVVLEMACLETIKVFDSCCF